MSLALCVRLISLINQLHPQIAPRLVCVLWLHRLAAMMSPIFGHNAANFQIVLRYFHQR